MLNIYIYMFNFRLFYRFVQKLKDEHIEFTALNEIGELPHNGALLVTTEEDLKNITPNAIMDRIKPSGRILTLNPKNSIEHSFLKCLEASKIQGKTNKLTIAIDPGSEMIGIAIFLDDILIHSVLANNFHVLMKNINSTLKIFPDKSNLIKLGNGNHQLTHEFLNRLFSEKFEAQIEFMLVNENNTSTLKNELSVHQNAAIAIGKREGQLVSSKNNN